MNDDSKILAKLKEYETVPNIDQLLRDCQQEIEILEMILKDSKNRYIQLKDTYPTESIFTSIYNWICYQFQFLE